MCVCASRGHYRAAKVATLKLGKKPKGCERERWRDGEKKKKKKSAQDNKMYHSLGSSDKPKSG